MNNHYNELHKRLRSDPTPDLIATLKSELLSPNMMHMNRALVTDGLKYLVTHCSSIEPESISTLVNLITTERSPTTQSLLIDLLNKSNAPDSAIAPLIPLFFKTCIAWRDEDTPLICALSRMSNRLINLPGGAKICFLLSVSDIPYVRTTLCRQLGNRKETTTTDSILSRLSAEDKSDIAVNWLAQIEHRLKTDKWGDPITSFVSEFFITNCVIDGADTYYIESILPLSDLRTARERYLRHLKS